MIHKTRVIYPDRAKILFATDLEYPQKLAILYLLCDGAPRLKSQVAGLLGIHYNTLTPIFPVMQQESMIEQINTLVRITPQGSLLILKHRSKLKDLAGDNA